jgi:aspartate/glutamate racemase
MAQVAGGPQPARVGFIHTTPATIDMVERYMKECLPGTAYVHVYDGNVKVDNFRSPIGQTPKRNLLRFTVFASELERAGCELIVSCCSLMPRATAFAAQVVSVPFIQLDAVVLDRAAAQFRRIGVINTTPYTVPYVEEALRERASRLGKQIQLEFSNTDSALEHFNAGDFEEHDRIVLGDVRRMSERGVDCILMGQIPFALMDRKLEGLGLKVPVLCAGREAFQRIGDLLEQRADRPGVAQ